MPNRIPLDEDHFEMEMTIRHNGEVVATETVLLRRLQTPAYDAAASLARRVTIAARKRLGFFERRGA